MENPQHGVLITHNDNWYFCKGTKPTNKPILLPNLEEKATSMINCSYLANGHVRFRTIRHTREHGQLSSIVARHISASNLSTHQLPTLLQHKHLNADDKATWDAAYSEEYDGLNNLPCWKVIPAHDFKRLRTPQTKCLPTMAISTIKYDRDGLPKRAKYRIVALGNLENSAWSKGDVYAPVLSLMELRFLTALEVRNKTVLKSADVKEAFVQAHLPDDEQYILKPPPGCPKTAPNLYWLLLHYYK